MQVCAAENSRGTALHISPRFMPISGYGYRFTALWTEICLRDPTVRLQKCSAAHPPRSSHSGPAALPRREQSIDRKSFTYKSMDCDLFHASLRRRKFSWDSTPHFAQIHAHFWDTATDSRHFGRKSVCATPPSAFRSVLRRTLLGRSGYGRLTPRMERDDKRLPLGAAVMWINARRRGERGHVVEGATTHATVVREDGARLRLRWEDLLAEDRARQRTIVTDFDRAQVRFEVGDVVVFTARDGSTMLGTVEKLNPKRARGC